MQSSKFPSSRVGFAILAPPFLNLLTANWVAEHVRWEMLRLIFLLIAQRFVISDYFKFSSDSGCFNGAFSGCGGVRMSRGRKCTRGKALTSFWEGNENTFHDDYRNNGTVERIQCKAMAKKQQFLTTEKFIPIAITLGDRWFRLNNVARDIKFNWIFTG